MIGIPPTGGTIFIRNNLFIDYSNFVVLPHTGVMLELNSFLSPGEETIRLFSGGSILHPVGSAANNYWGTTDTTVIDSMIWDAADDLAISQYVDYLPILDAPHPDTPTVADLP